VTRAARSWRDAFIGLLGLHVFLPGILKPSELKLIMADEIRAMLEERFK
jgi:hypothetical protein